MPSEDQGINTDRYKVVPRTLIFLQKERSFLLLRGASNKRLWANKYNGIGGHVEKGESIMEAAVRELTEETGLQAELWQCGTLLVDTGSDTGVCVFIFLGRIFTGDLTHSHEGMAEWVSIEDLDRYPLIEDLPPILRRIVDMQTGDAPFHARSFYDIKGNLTLTMD